MAASFSAYTMLTPKLTDLQQARWSQSSFSETPRQSRTITAAESSSSWRWAVIATLFRCALHESDSCAHVQMTRIDGHELRPTIASAYPDRTNTWTHVNAQAFGLVIIDGCPGIVMECLSESLLDLLEREAGKHARRVGSVLPYDALCTIGSQLIDVLAFLHGHNVRPQLSAAIRASCAARALGNFAYTRSLFERMIAAQASDVARKCKCKG